MKITLVMIQKAEERWIDSAWIKVESAKERSDSLMTQFKRMGFDPKPNGTWSWTVAVELEDGHAA